MARLCGLRDSERVSIRPTHGLMVHARRAAVGAVCGSVAGVVLALMQSHPFEGLILGAAAGTVFALALPARPEASAGTALTTATLGIAAWLIVDILLGPVLSGRPPQWTAVGMRAAFPGLVGWRFRRR